MVQLSKLIEEFEIQWPLEAAESWDTVGLVVGDANQQINKILLSVDLTPEVISEAETIGAELILTHHPVIFKPIETLANTTLKGALLTRLIRGGIAVYSVHTNADVQSDGSSSQIAKALELRSIKPIVHAAQGFGHGAIGYLEEALTVGRLVELLGSKIPQTARGIAFTGDSNRKVRSVAVSGGAGDSFLTEVLASDADVYITSDLRHHPALDALMSPRAHQITLIDISHYAAESLWLDSAKERLEQVMEVQIVQSAINTDVWTEVLK